ncbi:serine/threonine protein kinase [Neorhodopirellula lusitana]|uniref:Serine/threonine protein kinase n=1 Tax=Neorhodopirellula lusitana TaxID=445327 RepID=A0ABY1PWC2_9BACT|nr:serine/threonine-protein kinase [Neorhodopirellula lusitana]SMP50026.1 serine/threonine protein kinase [Neorhodopirellula lusitana]
MQLMSGKSRLSDTVNSVSADSTAQPRPILDDETRALVKRALASGVLKLDEIKTVVASLLTENVVVDCNRLAEGLQNSGLLTRWQAAKLLAGKSKGFYLGAYKLLRPLGKGGMGMVYLGEHQVMKRQMALKVLPPESLQDERRIRRFKEEARASAQLDHVNIVRAYDFNEAGGKLYIVMEYVDGIDLHQVIVRDGVMSFAAAVDAMTQACRGLAHAHERGVIHRDIKPSNLMLRSDGVVKISDMGLARIGWTESGDANDGKRLMGTADFVAPEQALNSMTVDARADIYSLGCTLYFLLTGRPPFRGDTVAQRLAKHQTAPLPDIRKLRPDCPASLINLLSRMMAKKPSERPSSVVDLLGQFERLKGGVFGTPGEHDQLADRVHSSDTSLDDRLFQATMDDGSSHPSDSVEVVDNVEIVEEFDFGTLPPLNDEGGVSAGSTFDSLGQFDSIGQFSSASQSQALTNPSAFPDKSDPAKPSRSSVVQAKRQSQDGQMMILGVGLAIAILALVLVVGMVAYTVSRPLPNQPSKLKSLEDGKGGRIIVIQ